MASYNDKKSGVKMRPLLRALLMLTTSLGCAFAAQQQVRPAVVELFTSQGCSSCPPADAYVGELAQRPGVLALSFHVDYWDHLGWHDRFGISEAAARQRDYARTLHLSSVFTPQVIIDGQDSYVGSDRASIGRALIATRSGPAVKLSISGGDLLVDLDEEKSFSRPDVLLIPYTRAALSSIGRGENSGRTLKEYNIVRSLSILGQWTGQEKQYRVAIRSFPREATDVAVILQSHGQAAIIGAASLSLY